jgi:hypothetical protein
MRILNCACHWMLHASLQDEKNSKTKIGIVNRSSKYFYKWKSSVIKDLALYINHATIATFITLRLPFKFVTNFLLLHSEFSVVTYLSRYSIDYLAFLICRVDNKTSSAFSRKLKECK